MNRQHVYQIFIALLILLFSYTAISKILDPYRFVFQMKLSPFSMVKNLADLWGWFIPVMEIIAVLALVFQKTQKTGLYLSLFLLLVFETYIVGMLMTGLKLPCACGGVIAFMSWKMHVVFNAVFIVINVIAIRLSDRSRLAYSS